LFNGSCLSPVDSLCPKSSMKSKRKVTPLRSEFILKIPSITFCPTTEN
jgi:hypothetical protein